MKVFDIVILLTAQVMVSKTFAKIYDLCLCNYIRTPNFEYACDKLRRLFHCMITIYCFLFLALV